MQPGGRAGGRRPRACRPRAARHGRPRRLPAIHYEHGSKLVLEALVLLALDAQGGEAGRAAQDGVGRPPLPQLGHAFLLFFVGVRVVELGRGGRDQAQALGVLLSVFVPSAYTAESKHVVVSLMHVGWMFQGTCYQRGAAHSRNRTLPRHPQQSCPHPRCLVRPWHEIAYL